MEDIKVVKVDEIKSDKYGDKKVLTVEDGSKWNVNEKKPFYHIISGPGIYCADFKEFQGKQYISYLKFKSALDGQNQPTTGFSHAGGVTIPASSYDANMKARLNADKKRQDDIRLEFYCGIAKDILIANKKDGVDINPNDTIAIGLDLFKRHVDILNNMYAEEEKNKQVPSDNGDTYRRAKEAVEELKAATYDDAF